MNRKILPAILAAAMVTMAAAPAFADRDDWRHHHHYHRPYATYSPGYVYAPPPVVYAPPPPPPVYAGPTFNISIPLR